MGLHLSLYGGGGGGVPLLGSLGFMGVRLGFRLGFCLGGFF